MADDFDPNLDPATQAARAVLDRWLTSTAAENDASRRLRGPCSLRPRNAASGSGGWVGMTTSQPQIGECLLTRHFDAQRMGDVISVTRADPRIRISEELLQEIVDANERGDREWAQLDGDVLTIRGVNRTVVYRIDREDWDFASCSYGAEWPD